MTFAGLVRRRLRLPWWTNIGPLGRTIARTRSMKPRPVLILSMPRSGSSWIGEILGAAPNAAYLREPINQSYLNNEGCGQSSLIEINADSVAPPSYVSARAKVGAAIPDFEYDVVSDRAQWSLRSRPARTLVVKEVNPLAIRYFLQDFRPYVIYLTRHPAAVANSFFVRGWTGERLSDSSLARLGRARHFRADSFWFNLGVVQAYAHHMVLSALSDYEGWHHVRYEHLCIDPMQEFSVLFGLCGLQFDEKSRERVSRSADAREVYRPGEYSTQRDSPVMSTMWRLLVSPAQCAELRDGYATISPSVYNAPEDW